MIGTGAPTPERGSAPAGLMGPPPGADPAISTPVHTAPPDPAQAPTQHARFDDAHQRLAAWVRNRFLRRPGVGPDTADDLAQRTWTAVWKALAGGAYDPARASLGTFVYAVAENIWRQHAKASRRPAVPDDLVPPGDSGDTAISSIALADLIERARFALGEGAGRAGLSSQDVQILQLLSRGASDRALAEQLAVAPSTAHARKRAALDKLRAFLAPAERPPAPGEQTL